MSAQHPPHPGPQATAAASACHTAASDDAAPATGAPTSTAAGTPTSTVTLVTTSAEGTRAVGARLAGLLRAGDLVLLSGGLGAGKTTLAQGIGGALEVRGRVSSPTFVIARLHPALGRGPDLIHVDAYRLESLEEVDALDLDASMEASVTLVEWGRGKVESLAAERLEVEVRRPHGGLEAAAPQGAECAEEDSAQARPTDLAQVDDGRREIVVRGLGGRWAGATLEGLGEGDE